MLSREQYLYIKHILYCGIVAIAKPLWPERALVVQTTLHGWKSCTEWPNEMKPPFRFFLSYGMSKRVNDSVRRLRVASSANIEHATCLKIAIDLVLNREDVTVLHVRNTHNAAITLLGVVMTIVMCLIVGGCHKCLHALIPSSKGEVSIGTMVQDVSITVSESIEVHTLT